jgi:hypothetical protein
MALDAAGKQGLAAAGKAVGARGATRAFRMMMNLIFAGTVPQAGGGRPACGTATPVHPWALSLCLPGRRRQNVYAYVRTKPDTK